MKTTPVTPEDLAASVLAVPPMARHPDYSLNISANKAMIRLNRNCGARAVRTIPHYYSDPDEAGLVMELKLRK